MSRDSHAVAGPHGEIRIEGDALAGLVVAAAELTDGVRVRRPRRGLDVAVANGAVRVDVQLVAEYGTVLPEVARAFQATVTATIAESTGLTVDRVDLSIEELDR